jgi:hypothetical protein
MSLNLMGSFVWKVNTNHNPLTISQPIETIIILRKTVASSTFMQMMDLYAESITTIYCLLLYVYNVPSVL